MNCMKAIVVLLALVCVSDACTKIAGSAQPMTISATTSSTTTTTTTTTTIATCNSACVPSTTGQLAVPTDPQIIVGVGGPNATSLGVTTFSIPDNVPTIACSGTGSIATGQLAQILCTTPGTPDGQDFDLTAVATSFGPPSVFTSSITPIPVQIVCGANGWEVPEIPGEPVIATACVPID